MTYEVFRYIFIIALILCAALFVTSVILFIVMNIPKIIQDLSGITAKKAIKEIREQNEKTGDKSYKVSQVNRERGKLTDKISQSGNIIRQSSTMKMGYSVETEKIGNSTAQVPFTGDETSVLSDPNVAGFVNETTVLSNLNDAASVSETTVLGSDADGSTVGITTVLSDLNINENTTVLENTAVNPGFVIEFEITYIHTNELIETEVSV